MELRDYGVALRRHWGIGVSVALACLLAAVVVVLATPATYRATAQVFVASTGEGTSGAQFVNQRVTSYPDVARSRAVLDEFGTVVEQLERPTGAPSPVDLTVTNPATVPTSPASPQTGLLLALGLVVGLALGAAAAVTRAPPDSRLHSAH